MQRMFQVCGSFTTRKRVVKLVLRVYPLGVRAELTQGTAQNVVDVENLFHCILTHLSPQDHKEINHRVCFTLLALSAFSLSLSLSQGAHFSAA